VFEATFNLFQYRECDRFLYILGRALGVVCEFAALVRLTRVRETVDHAGLVFKLTCSHIGFEDRLEVRRVQLVGRREGSERVVCTGHVHTKVDLRRIAFADLAVSVELVLQDRFFRFPTIESQLWQRHNHVSVGRLRLIKFLSEPLGVEY